MIAFIKRILGLETEASEDTVPAFQIHPGWISFWRGEHHNR